MVPQFVHVQQTFLNILIEKAGIFQQAVPLVGTRVAAVLRSVEGVDDVRTEPPRPLGSLSRDINRHVVSLVAW